MPNYKEIETLLESHQAFKHAHSMRAERHADAYRVFSYSTLIAEFVWDTAEWSLNEHKYSVTTSKQQNILRRVIARATK